MAATGAGVGCSIAAVVGGFVGKGASVFLRPSPNSCVHARPTLSRNPATPIFLATAAIVTPLLESAQPTARAQSELSPTGPRRSGRPRHPSALCSNDVRSATPWHERGPHRSQLTTRRGTHLIGRDLGWVCRDDGAPCPLPQAHSSGSHRSAIAVCTMNRSNAS